MGQNSSTTQKTFLRFPKIMTWCDILCAVVPLQLHLLISRLGKDQMNFILCSDIWNLCFERMCSFFFTLALRVRCSKGSRTRHKYLLKLYKINYFWMTVPPFSWACFSTLVLKRIDADQFSAWEFHAQNQPIYFQSEENGLIKHLLSYRSY